MTVADVAAILSLTRAFARPEEMRMRFPGFWSNGPRQVERALREQEGLAIARLKEALAAEEDPGRVAEIKRQIRMTREEYKRKRKEAGEGLYLKR